MLFYFLLSALSGYNGVPAIVDLAARDSPLCPEACKYQTQRTLFGIVCSCVSTTILCAWTAVHPNVPPRGKWKARWHRLSLMFWMIVAPELVLAWAVRQLFAAKDIRDTYNNNQMTRPVRWTLIQGHLLCMGGFTLVDPGLKTTYPKDYKGQVLTKVHFEQLILNTKFEFADVTEDDIRDRSKGDVLFKLIAILQTTWFIIQCVARGQLHLALTELELVTLALASLNAVTFAIWWKKPLGVAEPVRIYWRTEMPKIEDVTRQEDQCFELSFGDIVRSGWKDITALASAMANFFRDPCGDGLVKFLFNLFIDFPITIIYIITFPIFVLFPFGIILLLRVVKTEPATQDTVQNRGLLAAQIVASMQNLRYQCSSAIGGFVAKKLKKIFDGTFGDATDFFGGFFLNWFFLLPLLSVLLFLFTIFLTPFLTLLFLISFIFTAVFGIVTTCTICPGACHVPTFYAPITKNDRWCRMVIFVLFGVIFGGVHCVGWYFQYPTRSEQTHWQATSLTITVIPVIVAPIDFLLANRLHNRDINSCPRFERITLLVLDLVMTILLFIYVPIRLSLIAQALVLLRSQPDSAFIAVDWTKYIPHVFSQS